MPAIRELADVVDWRLCLGWRQLSLRDRLRSTAGTLRGILTRKLYRPLRLSPKEAVPVKPAVMGKGDPETVAD